MPGSDSRQIGPTRQGIDAGPEVDHKLDVGEIGKKSFRWAPRKHVADVLGIAHVWIDPEIEIGKIALERLAPFAGFIELGIKQQGLGLSRRSAFRQYWGGVGHVTPRSCPGPVR